VPALAAAAGDSPETVVFVPAIGTQTLARTFYQAEGIASDIFSRIGLKVRWRQTKDRPRGCSREPMHHTIVMAFSMNTPPGFHPEAMALAYPYQVDGACVSIFMDRLTPMADANPTTSAYLLGHILAHEIGHVLQGTEHHSERGVLKAHWSQTEIRRMPFESLRFTDYDAALILNRFREGPTLNRIPSGSGGLPE